MDGRIIYLSLDFLTVNWYIKVSMMSKTKTISLALVPVAGLLLGVVVIIPKARETGF